MIGVGDRVRVKDWPGIDASRDWYIVAEFREYPSGETARLTATDRHGYPTNEPDRFVLVSHLVARKARGKAGE